MGIKNKDGSYLRNCYVSRRKCDQTYTLFTETDESVTTSLNGYAIIPLTEYADLTGKDFDGLIKQAEEDEKITKEGWPTDLRSPAYYGESMYNCRYD